MWNPDAIFEDPRTLRVYWATFGAELRPIDLGNQQHVDRVNNARQALAAFGYHEHAVKLYIEECLRAEPLK